MGGLVQFGGEGCDLGDFKDCSHGCGKTKYAYLVPPMLDQALAGQDNALIYTYPSAATLQAFGGVVITLEITTSPAAPCTRQRDAKVRPKWRLAHVCLVQKAQTGFPSLHTEWLDVARWLYLCLQICQRACRNRVAGKSPDMVVAAGAEEDKSLIGASVPHGFWAVRIVIVIAPSSFVPGRASAVAPCRGDAAKERLHSMGSRHRIEDCVSSISEQGSDVGEGDGDICTLVTFAAVGRCVCCCSLRRKEGCADDPNPWFGIFAWHVCLARVLAPHPPP